MHLRVSGKCSERACAMQTGLFWRGNQPGPHSPELPGEPSYPKMPGEPPRVQPSKKVAAHWKDDGSPAT